MQNRQRELHQLQESVVELAQLYKQLEHLISDQDLTFQQIEESVIKSESDIEKGRVEVDNALTLGISARKVKQIDAPVLCLHRLANLPTNTFNTFLSIEKMDCTRHRGSHHHHHSHHWCHSRMVP